MTYEQTPISKTPSNLAISKELETMLDKFSSRKLMWRLIRRHKFGLLISYAATITVLYFVPFAPQLVLSLFNK